MDHILDGDTQRNSFYLQEFMEKRKEERIPRLSATLLSGDSFVSPIFVLKLSLAVVLGRSPA